MLKTLVLAVFSLSLVALIGCGSDEEVRDLGAPDLALPADMTAAVADLAGPDLVSFDGTPPCMPESVLDGTSTIAAQGWTVNGTAGAITTNGTLVDFDTTGASVQALASKDLGIASGAAYSLEWGLQVLATDGHNPLDAPVAFMASFSPPFGTTSERSQMIYFDAADIGWADDTQRFTVDTTSAHVYRLDVTAAGHAEVHVDGTLALTRDSFQTNGTVAVGDQTNDPGVDSHFQLSSLRTLCP